MVFVFGYLFISFGDYVYVIGRDKVSVNRIVGFFYSLIWVKYESRVLSLFKGNDGVVRVVIVLFVFSMGVNYLDVKYVIYFGLVRSVVDYI